MKKLIISVLILLSTQANAWQKLETGDEQRQRISAERYQTYKSNNYRAPLGGYRDKLGDTTPYGTATPGLRQYDYNSRDYNQNYFK